MSKFVLKKFQYRITQSYLQTAISDLTKVLGPGSHLAPDVVPRPSGYTRSDRAFAVLEHRYKIEQRETPTHIDVELWINLGDVKEKVAKRLAKELQSVMFLYSPELEMSRRFGLPIKPLKIPES